MRSITVEPEQLESCAARMEQTNQDYLQNMQQLFHAVDAMQSAWQGRDNTAFTSEISKFEGDFRQISLLCEQYTDFLRTSARAYRDTQDEIAAQAGRI